MAQKKTAGAARPAAKKADKKTETELALALPTLAAPEGEAADAAPEKSVAVKRPAAVAARKPRAKEATVLTVVGYEDLSAAGQEAVDTYLTCSEIAAQGVETLGKEVVGFARATVEAQFAFAKTLMDAKSLEDAMAAQSDYTAKNIDHLTAQAAKLTEMSVKLANRIMAPIQARATATTETWLKPLAA